MKHWCGLAVLLSLVLGSALPASAEESIGLWRPMDWRPEDLWSSFWSSRWEEGITTSRRLSLSEVRGGVQSQVVYDPLLGYITASLRQRDVELAPARLFTTEQYAAEAARLEFYRSWKVETLRTLHGGTADPNRRIQGGLVNVDLPFELPGFAAKIFGDGAPNLRVSGSERISIGGTSSWRVNELQTEGRRRSRFPTLEMRQELNVRLNGTIGDKLHIDISQNSEASISLENQIRIYYQGYEDDVIQRVDLGNTNLSLPRTTQYISYSSRQEGLFGIKMTGRFADWDFSMIASKQEGASGAATFTGGTSESRLGGSDGRIYDREFERRKYFFLFDPDEETLPPNGVIRGEDLVVWVDTTNPEGDRRSGKDIARGMLSLRGNGTTPPGLSVKSIVKWTPNDDYFFITSDRTDYPYLVMRNSISEDYSVGVSYRVRDRNTGNVLQDVGNFFTRTPADSILQVKMIKPGRSLLLDDNLTVGAWAATRKLELKNVYNLGARNIDGESLALSIRKEGGLDPPDDNGVYYLEILGLDLINNQTGLPGADGKVDPRYIDLENGLLYFPDLRPFDPSLVDLQGQPGTRAPSRDVPRRRALGYRAIPDASFPSGFRFEPLSPDSARDITNPLIYDRRELRDDYRRYFITGTFRAFQTDISLNQPGILENSETVRMDGEVLSRGVDYTISYDTGQVRLISDKATNPNGNLQISYSYTPLFSRGDKSLIGFSTTYGGSSNWAFSTTLLYESKGVPERRPRLQQEPSRTILGDVSGAIRLTPWFLTEMTDALPLVSTSAPSRLTLTGAMGLSVPNPNTKGDVYLDDMEGAAQVTGASMARESWRFSSRPATDALKPFSEDALRDADRLDGLWYSIQRLIQAKDLAPNLDLTEGDDYISGLGVILGPNPFAEARPWFGITQPLSDNGLRLTEAQYIEVWVNDFNRFHGANAVAGQGKEIRINLGSVSEDAIWDPNTPPAAADGMLNSEDVNRDGQRTPDEDTGLDGLVDSRETGREPLPGDPCPVAIAGDPAGDNFSFDSSGDEYVGTMQDRFCRFRHVNGTEKNLRLDSEDFNGNENLDVINDYFEYTLPLDSDEFTVVDVARDYPNSEAARDPENGWRLLRIPLNHPSVRQVGFPSLDTVRHLRVWFNGFSEMAEFQIASIEVIGNRWERQPIRAFNEKDVPDSVQFAAGKVFNVAVVNNKQNADVYAPPFPVRRLDRVTEREQSLALVFENIDPGEQVSAFRSLLREEDYTLYQTLAYYVRRRPGVQADNLEFFLRFSSTANSDVQNAYEISLRLDKSDEWQTIELPLADISRLKIDVPDSLLGLPSRLNAESDLPGGLHVRIFGKPSFSQVRRLQVGVRNVGVVPVQTGEVWFNELRLGSVRRDVGVAAGGSVDMSLGDFASLRTSLDQRDADFLALGQTRGSGLTSRTLSFGTTVNLDKLMPSLSLSLPAGYDVRRTRNTPKFRANDDIIFEGGDGGYNITESGSNSIRLSARRISTQGTPWILRNTLDAVALNLSYSRAFNSSTTGVDSTLTATGTASYALRMGNWLALPLPGRSRFTPLPNLSVSYAAGYNENVSYSRNALRPTELVSPRKTTTRTSGLQFQSDFRPVSPVTYSVSSQRDLVKDRFARFQVGETNYRPSLVIGGVDLGREISRSERLSVSQSFSFTSFIRPRVSWTGEYRENHSPDLTTPSDLQNADQVNPDLKSFQNSNTTTVGMTLPMAQLFRKLQGVGGPQRNRPVRGQDTPPAQHPLPPPAPPQPQVAPPQPDSLGVPEDEPGDESRRPGGPDGGAGTEAFDPGAVFGTAGNPTGSDLPPEGITVPPSVGPEDVLKADADGSTQGGQPVDLGATGPPTDVEAVDADSLAKPAPVDDKSDPRKASVKKRKKNRPRGGIGGTSRDEPEEEEVIAEEPNKEKEAPAPVRTEEPVRKAEPPPAPKPAVPGPNLFQFLFRDLFAVGDIRTNISRSNSNSISRVHGSPSPEFRLGLSNEFGDVQRADNSSETHSNSTSASANSTISVLRDFSVDAAFQWTEQETDNNRSLSRSESTTWPGLRMNLGALEKKLGLKRIFNSFSATSNYERRTEKRGTGTNPRESETTTTAWRPLLQFDAGLKNGWRTTFSTDRSSTISTSNSAGGVQAGVTTTRNQQAFRAGLAKSFSVDRGPGKPKSSVDLTFDVNYNRDESINEYSTQSPVENRSDNFQGRLSSSYRFTSTVSGSMQLTVGQRRDLDADLTDRSIGLQATAAISF